MKKRMEMVESVNNKIKGGDKKKMKTKTKILAIGEIAIVLCSVFLVALPGIAAEQNQEMQKVSASEVTTASEDDFVLEIYGNANEDDTIDMRDTTYIKLVIFKKKPKTDFADANHDGKVSMLDIGQTKLIILGKEKELTLLDMADRVVTVPRPIERIVSCDIDSLTVIATLGTVDRIVGVPNYIGKYGKDIMVAGAHPELDELPAVGAYKTLNAELIVSLKPDVIFTSSRYVDVADSLREKTGTPVVGVTILKDTYGAETYSLVGTIISKEDEAEETVSYLYEKLDEVKTVTADIPDSEKPKVYFVLWPNKGVTNTYFYYSPINTAGGINVAEVLKTDGVRYGEVSKEQILDWNPDIIVVHGALLYVRQQLIENVLSDPDIQSVSAIKDKRVYYTKGPFTGWDPATGVAETFYMAKLFHPDKFEELDVEKECNEILERVYGVDGLWTGITEGWTWWE